MKGLLIGLSLLAAITIAAAACGGGGSATPQPGDRVTATPSTPTTLPPPSGGGGIGEWEARDQVTEHFYAMATTYHGQLVLAEVIDQTHGGAHRQDRDGSWEIEIWIEDWYVEGNPLLEPIFDDPMRRCESAGQAYSVHPDFSCSAGDHDRGVFYEMEWLVSADGVEVRPTDGNAIRFQAELQKP
ncbi:hypothetical protein ACFLST_00045 [Chloroflexota bacterium]